MGKSAPPPANVDLVHSYARQVGEEVEIVLSRLEVELAPDDVVVLRQGSKRVRMTPVVTGEGDTRRVAVRTPRSDLGRGTWAVALRTSTGRTPLGCRLLVQGRRPLVLLWGDDPVASRLPDPNPRSASPSRGVVPGRSALGALRGGPREIAAALRRRVRRSS